MVFGFNGYLSLSVTSKKGMDGKCMDKGRREVNGGTQNVGIYSRVIKISLPSPKYLLAREGYVG
jgi:hypothetical protein